MVHDDAWIRTVKLLERRGGEKIEWFELRSQRLTVTGDRVAAHEDEPHSSGDQR